MAQGIKRERSLRDGGEWPTLYYTHLTLGPTLGSQGRGIAKELIKGAFGWGSPPKFKKGGRHLCL